jgi:hypothetical protein
MSTNATGTMPYFTRSQPAISSNDTNNESSIETQPQQAADNGEGPSRQPDTLHPRVEEVAEFGDEESSRYVLNDDVVMTDSAGAPSVSQHDTGTSTSFDDYIEYQDYDDDQLSQAVEESRTAYEETRIAELSTAIYNGDEAVMRLYSERSAPPHEAADLNTHIRGWRSELETLMQRKMARISAIPESPVPIPPAVPQRVTRGVPPAGEQFVLPHHGLYPQDAAPQMSAVPMNQDSVPTAVPINALASPPLNFQRQYETVPRNFAGSDQEVILEDQIKPEPHNVKELRDMQKALKCKTPKEWDGKGLTDLDRFLSDWNQVFRAQEWMYNTHSSRVHVAATTLVGSAKDLWNTAIESDPPLITHLNWPNFIRLLRSSVSNKTTREEDAVHNLKGFHLKKGESIASLFTRYTQIIRDLPTKTDAQKISDLVSSFPRDSSIDRKYKDYSFNKKPTTVLEFITLAGVAQTALPPYDAYAREGKAQPNGHRVLDTQSGPSRPKKDSYRVQKDKRSGSQQPSRRNNGGSTSTEDSVFTPVCYNCGKKGHKSPDCRSKKENPGNAYDPNRYRKRTHSQGNRDHRDRSPAGESRVAALKQSQKALNDYYAEKRVKTQGKGVVKS